MKKQGQSKDVNVPDFFKDFDPKKPSGKATPVAPTAVPAPTAAVPAAPTQPAATPKAPAGKGMFDGFNYDPNKPVGSKHTAPTGQSNTQSTHTGFGQSIPAVEEMQKAILDFAKIVSGHAAYQRTITPQGVDNNPEKGNYDSFNEFLLNQFMKKDKKNEGAGMVGVDLNSPNRMNTSTPLADTTNLRNWIDTITHVGTQATGGESKPDGVWGDRTNNAIRDIKTFATSLLQIGKALGVSVGEYGEKEIAGLIVPSDPKEIQDKAKTAAIITSHIKGITVMYEGFRKSVLDSSTFGPYISQKKPLFSHDAGLKPEDQKMLSGQSNQKVMGNGSTVDGIIYSDLKDVGSFKAWLKKNNKPYENNNDVLAGLNDLTNLVKNPSGM